MVEFVEDAKTLREIQVNRLMKNMVLLDIFYFDLVHPNQGQKKGKCSTYCWFR